MFEKEQKYQQEICIKKDMFTKGIITKEISRE